MTTVEILARLTDMQHEIEAVRRAAEASKLPTAITIGLEWLREDTGKVIADVDVALLKMGQ
jgi:hypothetical protein